MMCARCQLHVWLTLDQQLFGLGCDACEGFGFAWIVVEFRQELSVAQMQLCKDLPVCTSNLHMIFTEHTSKGTI